MYLLLAYATLALSACDGSGANLDNQLNGSLSAVGITGNGLAL